MSAGPERSGRALRVLDLAGRPGRLGPAVRRTAPDLVCLAEGPHRLRWRARAAELARSGGLSVVVGGPAAGGPLLLAALRVRIRAVREIPLSRTRRLPRRGAVAAVVEAGGTAYAVVAVRLGTDPAERRRHVDELLYQLADLPAPLVLVGEVGESSEGPGWRVLAERLRPAAYADAGGLAGRGTHAGFLDRRLDDGAVEIVMVGTSEPTWR